MKLMFMPSLKHIALIKVSAELWNLYDIRDLMARISTPTRLSEEICQCSEWQEIEEKTMEKVPELTLPESLKKEIMNFIRPVGLQIYNWKRYLCEILTLDSNLTVKEFTKWLSLPCWTPQGTVDKKKMAKAFIKDHNLDITKRYVLACNFSLEEDIKELWNSLPERRKEEFYNEFHSGFYISEHTLVWLWTCNVTGELAKLNGRIKYETGREISAYLFAFEIASLVANKTAAEYFFRKLTPLEREESCEWYIKHAGIRGRGVIDADVLYFLLSQINEEQQVKVFETSPYEVLLHLLDWPRQRFFMEAANCTWDFLPERDYAYIQWKIVNRMILGFKDWDYHKLFVEFWEQCPSTFREYVVSDCVENWILLCLLFQLEDKEKIRLILKNATVEERENIIFHSEGKSKCYHLICSDSFDLLNFFVQECLQSVDITIKFKEEFKCYASKERSVPEKYTKFFQILDDLIAKNSKRTDIEYATSSLSKRLM